MCKNILLENLLQIFTKKVSKDLHIVQTRLGVTETGTEKFSSYQYIK